MSKTRAHTTPFFKFLPVAHPKQRIRAATPELTEQRVSHSKCAQKGQQHQPTCISSAIPICWPSAYQDMNSPLTSKQDRILLVPLYRNAGIGREFGREADSHSPASWWGTAEARRCLSAAGCNSPSRAQRNGWSPGRRLDLTLDPISHQRHANVSGCLIPATTPSNKRPWGRKEARTYVFARYAHGSALLHLACLHDDTHHYWVTGVENKLREYFHLAREYCYMPGRRQGEGILKRLLERCREY